MDIDLYYIKDQKLLKTNPETIKLSSTAVRIGQNVHILIIASKKFFTIISLLLGELSHLLTLGIFSLLICNISTIFWILLAIFAMQQISAPFSEDKLASCSFNLAISCCALLMGSLEKFQRKAKFL